MQKDEEQLPFGFSWNQMYIFLIAAHVIVVVLFLLFSNSFSN